MYSEKELKQIEVEIEICNIELNGLKKQLEIDIKVLKEKYKKDKRDILDKKAKFVKKIKWQEFSNSHYTKKDYAGTIAYKLFGKRKKDLTEEERKEYNRICTRLSRERNKK